MKHGFCISKSPNPPYLPAERPIAFFGVLSPCPNALTGIVGHLVKLSVLYTSFSYGPIRISSFWGLKRATHEQKIDFAGLSLGDAGAFKWPQLPLNGVPFLP